MRYHVIPAFDGGWELTFNMTKLFRFRYRLTAIIYGLTQLIGNDKLYIHRKDGSIKRVIKWKGQ